MTQRDLGILRKLLALPTAPFHEGAVVAWIARWAGRRGLPLARDAAGNVVVRYRRGRANRPWVFAAHMDHPGFVARARRGRRLWADFIGSVRAEFFPGSRVRFFAGAAEAVGTAAALRKDKRLDWPRCRIELDEPANVPPDSIGMWDLPAWRVRGRRLSARSCDDVAGVAAVLCAIDELRRRRADADVTALLTRAEEAAFIGCLAACRARTVPLATPIIAIEASKAVPGATLGGGVVVRVGDAARTFEPSLTAHVAAVAARLARQGRGFRFVRQLMPGGTCESTAYAMFGYVATGLCLPLGNYHNQSPDGRIAAETIDLDDFAGLVRLLVAVACDRGGPAETDAALRRRLDGLLRARGRHLRTQ